MIGYFMYVEECDTEAAASHLVDEWMEQVGKTEDYRSGNIHISWTGSQAAVMIRKNAIGNYAIEDSRWGFPKIVVHKSTESV